MRETQRFGSSPISADTILMGVGIMENKQNDQEIEGWDAVQFLGDALTFIDQCIYRDLLQASVQERMDLIVHFDNLFLKYGKYLPQHWPGKETWRKLRKKLLDEGDTE